MNENTVLNYIVTCALGLESLVSKEIQAFGGTVLSQAPSHCIAQGDKKLGYDLCLWSRFASRVLLSIEQVEVSDEMALYKAATKLDWTKHLDIKHSFGIKADGEHATIQNNNFAALKVKDAIVDQFRSRYGARPNSDAHRPDVRLHVFLSAESAQFSIDLSGESLHKRGYRPEAVEAPLRESLAAAVAELAGVPGLSVESAGYDPMCGSGTLLIEAALMWAGIAPGLYRRQYGFQCWKGHDEKIWQLRLLDAERKRDDAMKQRWPRWVGYDADKEAIRIARQTIEGAGLAGKIHIERRELAFFDAENTEAPGVVMCNPPYGERLGEAESLRYLYRCLGRKLKQQLPGYRSAVITNNIELADALAMQSQVAPYRLYNGGLPVFLKISEIPEWIPERHQALSPVSTKNKVEAQDFYNRLEKNVKALRKEAEKYNVSSYRIYDADLPDYNFAIDLYENKIHLQEYAPPKTVDPEKAERRVRLAVEAIKALFRISENQISFKIRKRQKGSSQYTKQAGEAKLSEIKEGKGLYLINLTDYLDSGVFLDHRVVRELIFQRARGKRFLNLFAYTATATIQAALGQARSTVSVDMSPNYSKWARSNLCLNGFSESNHRTVVADCLKWLNTSKDQFDLILLDPPTFSNSKRTENVLDVQRDHVELIQLAMRRLEPGGELIFSNNYRKFKLDEEALLMFDVQPMSENTIPFDFKRKGNIHQCFSIRHRQRRSLIGSEGVNA